VKRTQHIVDEHFAIVRAAVSHAKCFGREVHHNGYFAHKFGTSGSFAKISLNEFDFVYNFV
jgi:hypothetical protein